MSEAHSTTNVSYWVDSTSAPERAVLQGDVHTDAAVVGAGIVGLTAARILTQAGKTVAVVEMDRVGRGVTGYTTAKITAGHSLIYQELEERHGEETAGAYAAANREALEQMAHWIEDGSIDCDFERLPNYVYLEMSEETSSIEREVEAAGRAGLEVSLVTETDLPYKVAAAVRLDNQAQFHPRKYLLHLAEDIEARGGRIFERSRVIDVKEANPCEVVTSGGRVLSDHVVMATHYPIWDRGLFFPRVHPKRSYAIAGPLNGLSVPAGMYISIDQPTRSVRTIRDGGRDLLMVGGNGHSAGQKYDTQNDYSELEHWMAERFGITEVTHRWSTQDGVTVDLIPYAGTARRGTDRVYTATGFGKWGMTNGTASAMVIADAILDRPNEFSSLFDPHRLTLKESASNFIRENAKVARHWIGDRIKHPQMGAFDDLAPGQAAVSCMGLEQVAGYRDDAGKLHAVSATCTHLGCIVTWNEGERSWDCPCHGSRFDHEGRVLHGPAVKDLQRKQLGVRPR
jgi:glycine/D-amino acid oxidase-like deaminating enzyme/nitrite reductase/ring-hydroxylating ferredoxin subunit